MVGSNDGPTIPNSLGSVLVLGEALCDLVIEADGSVTSALGGAPYNTARALGRLGVPTEFASSTSLGQPGLRRRPPWPQRPSPMTVPPPIASMSRAPRSSTLSRSRRVTAR